MESGVISSKLEFPGSNPIDEHPCIPCVEIVKMNDFHVIHAMSPWLGDADVVVSAPTEAGGVEYLPAKRLDVNAFKICCVPFEVYDIDQGDVVECTSEGLVRRMISKSGSVGFRFRSDQSHEAVREIVHAIREVGCEVEFAADGSVVAVNVPLRVSASHVSGLLLAFEEAGLLEYETVRTVEPEECPYDI